MPLHLREELLRFFQPHPRRTAHVQPQLASVHGWEEVLAEEREEGSGCERERDASSDPQRPARKGLLERASVGAEDAIEASLERRRPARPPLMRARLHLLAEEELHHRRYQRAREEVGSEH